MNTLQVSAERLSRFPYDGARRLAEGHGLTVVSVCHADLLPGTPIKDGYGNYVTARTVYIGQPGTLEKNCAFARVHHTIHQQTLPGLGDALSNIAYHLMYLDLFKDRAEYERYFNSPYRLSPHQQVDLRNAWHEHATTAQRAIRVLPADLIAFLREAIGQQP